jgi:hypothetical protein
VTGELEYVPPGVDVSRPSAARLYDYYLGGSNNYAVDRAAAERIRAMLPELSDLAWVNRGFLQRAVRWLAEQGVHQFIDLGAGLPTQSNTHEVAQKFDPDVRVVYVDHDPYVAIQAAHLLGDEPNTAVITADLRERAVVLEHPELNRLIDFEQPVGLLAVAVMHFVPERDDPWGIIDGYMRALAPGSYLVLSHGTSDRQSETVAEAVREVYRGAQDQMHDRTKPEVERFFEGLELVPPYPGARAGVTFVGEWGAEDPAAADSDGSRWFYGGVARRP